MFTVKLELGGANLKGARFQQQAASLNVSAESLYAALVADAENLPPSMDVQGRQVDVWKKYRAPRFVGLTPLLSTRFPSGDDSARNLLLRAFRAACLLRTDIHNDTHRAMTELSVGAARGLTVVSSNELD